jgi:hypothetical protein
MAKSIPNGTAVLDKFISQAEDQMDRTVVQTSRMLEKATELTKDNVAAMFASARIAATGIETLSKDASSRLQSMKDMSNGWPSLADAPREPQAMLKYQAGFMSSAIEKMIEDGSKFGGAMLKLGFDMAEPVAKRYSALKDLPSAWLER